MINHSPIIFTDLQPAPRKARARRTDCVESHNAAKRVELGKAERQRQWIRRVLAFCGPLTVPELAKREPPTPPWLAHELGKRINEVEGIAPTGESRNGSRVWALL